MKSERIACCGKALTNEEWLEYNCSKARIAFEVNKKCEEFTALLKRVAFGSTMFNKLCEKYGVDNTRRDAKEILYNKLMEEWLTEIHDDNAQ